MSVGGGNKHYYNVFYDERAKKHPPPGDASTGANTTPLANKKPGGSSSSLAGSLGGSSLLNPSYLALGNPAADTASGARKAIAMGTPAIMGGAGLTTNLDRPNMPTATLTMPVSVHRGRTEKREGETKEERAKRRKSRWTDECQKTFIPGLPTMIPEGLTKTQEEVGLILIDIDTNFLGILASTEDRGGLVETQEWGSGHSFQPRG